MNRHTSPKKIQAVIYLTLVAALTFACALPGRSTPQAEPTPTPFQEPLPPILIETSPPIGNQLGMNETITFYFNQPMKKDTVEAALYGLPSGFLEWGDDSTLTFTPDSSYETDAEITVAILTSASVS